MAVWNNFDSWLSGTIAFDFDEDGNLSAGHFKSKDGYTAEIFFTYDENKNLIQVHWTFSFNGTQTYTFEYKKTGA